MVPVIETERLRLRAHRLTDFEPMLAMWADEAVTRFIGGRPSTRDEVWSRLLRYVGHWSLLGYGYWAVEARDGGAYLGELGFADFKRDIDPPLDGVPELGWAFAGPAQGQGYATEGVQAAIAWGERHFAGARVVCMISPENAPSIRVAQKCGFREYGRTVYKDSDTILFERV